MQRVPYEIPGGSPGFRLIPESAIECTPSPVERAILLAAWTPRGGHQVAEAMAARARVELRDLNGYGAYLNFTLPEPAAGCDSSDIPGVGVGQDDSIVAVPWRAFPIGAQVTLRGMTGFVEIFPTDGTNLSCDECERLLFSPLGAIRVDPA